MLLLASTFVLALAAPAGAAEFQSTVMLDTIVAQFTGRPIGDMGGARTPIDNRLKLAACAAPQLEWRNDMRDAVVVRCMQPGWRIFVPVNAVPQPKTEVPAAQVKALPATKAELIIKRGDAVTVEIGSVGFSIMRDGVAASDAAAGGRLSVKMDEKKPPIQTIAVEPGRARLPGWED